MRQTTDARLRTPEVAKRLGISGRDVYRLIFGDELDGRPDEEGIVYVSETSVDRYLERRGRAPEPSTGSTDTSPDEDARSITPDSQNPSADARNDTEPNRPSGASEGS